MSVWLHDDGPLPSVLSRKMTTTTCCTVPYQSRGRHHSHAGPPAHRTPCRTTSSPDSMPDHHSSPDSMQSRSFQWRMWVRCSVHCCFTSTETVRAINNNGHFYGAWSLARSRAQCAVQKCINTYNGQNKKGFRPYDRQPRKNLHTAISVNKPKFSVTKHDQTLILALMYDTSRYTANAKMYSGILHTHTHTGVVGY